VAASFKRVTSVPHQRVRLIEEHFGSSSVLSKQDVLQYYQYTADRGDASAQFLIGQMYQQGGQGVEQNFETALVFLKRFVLGGLKKALD